MKVSHFLKTLAPDFMWCSMFDLYLMYEQIEEDCCYLNFKAHLSQKKVGGYFATKSADRTKTRGRVPLLYLRVK